MAITEVTDTTSVPNKIVKKFTTDLSAGEGQDSTTSGVVILQYNSPGILVKEGFEWL